VFANDRNRVRAQRASSFLRAASNALIASVVRDLGADRYSVEQILKIVIERAEKRRLWVQGSRRDSLRHARWMLARLTHVFAQGESPRLTV
jgi:hypothetical protein